VPKRRHRGQERRIAQERMDILFRLAEREALQRREARARRYVDLARRIGMRYNVRIPAEFKRRFCKGCGANVAGACPSCGADLDAALELHVQALQEVDLCLHDVLW